MVSIENPGSYDILSFFFTYSKRFLFIKLYRNRCKSWNHKLIPNIPSLYSVENLQKGRHINLMIMIIIIPTFFSTIFLILGFYDFEMQSLVTTHT